ncbi:MAG: dihydrolipoyl dehydrogenase [Pseudomonadota bacterium]
MADQSVDLVVIGGGPGGYVAAIRAAQLGMKVALAEREHLGGICLNWGCIPTKALLRTSEIYHYLHNLKDYGLKADNPGFDLDAVVKRSRGIAGQLNAGVRHLLKKNKVLVFDGAAKLTSSTSVEISGKSGNTSLKAANVMIATGARARELPHLKADGDRVWTYKHAMTPKTMPKSLLVIGSGAIGIEFASFYSDMGADVTVVEMMDRILPVEDAEISDFMAKTLTKQGINLHTEGTVEGLKVGKTSVDASLNLKGKGATKQSFDRVILAIGIQGNVEGLGLEDLGIKVDRGHIVTDGHGRTNVKNVWAIGDVTGAPWLAHKASHEGVIAVETITGLPDVHPLNKGNIPGCTYCRPQVASVGLTEKAAKEAGHKIKVGRFPFIGNGKAIALGEAEGIIKTIFDADTGELLGAHMAGAEVTELIQGYAVGRTLETTEVELMHTIFPHPTLSEMMHESVLDAYGRAIHF